MDSGKDQGLGTETIVEAYQKAHLNNPDGYLPENHSYMREDVILHMYEIMLLFRKAFLANGWSAREMGEKKILEVGCAWGYRLNQLTGFDLHHENLCGIDLLPQYVEMARRRYPGIRFEQMSATQMSFDDNSFDFSCAVMALSAMLDPKVIDDSLAEMCRVTRHSVLIVDDSNPAHENRRDGALYFKGIDPSRLQKLVDMGLAESVRELGSFWSTSATAWKLNSVLRKVGLESVAYAVAIRTLARHSHKAWLIKLNKETLDQ